MSQPAKLYATKRHPMELIVGGMERVEITFARPHYDPTPKGDTDPIYAELPKAWQYPARKVRGNYLRGHDLYTAIWGQVEASHSGEFKDWGKTPALVPYTEWLLEMDVAITDPTGIPGTDLTLYVTAGPVNQVEQGPDVVSLWLRQPKFQRVNLLDDDFVREYPVKFWDAISVGSGRIDVPDVLHSRVDELVQDRDDATDEWIGRLTVGVKMGGMRLVDWKG